MKLKKIAYVYAFFLVIILSVGGISAAASSLDDVPDKFSEEIDYLQKQGIIEGFPDGTFKPQEEVTREQAATIVGRTLGLDGEKRETVFSDVDEDSFAAGYIQAAYEADVITGYTDGTYQPLEQITRGEMAYLVTKAFSLEEKSDVHYEDVASEGSQYEAINKLTTAGLANGYTDGTFKPETSITRAEFSLLVARGLNPDYKVDSEQQAPTEERVVSTDVLNVRTGPSTDTDVIGKLNLGDIIQVHEETGDWLQFTKGNLNGYVHKDYTTEKPSSSHILALDAGHGGKDPGAEYNGLKEEEINLNVAKRVQEYLENAGIEVVMTREEDKYIELDERVDIAVDANADTFVSIHANAFSDESVSGVETFYSSSALSQRAADSKQLATFIHKYLLEAMEMNDRGVKDVPYRVIDHTPLPSALIELGFTTNDSDAEKLGSSYWRDQAAEAIYQGIIDYYNWKEEQ